MGGNFGIPKNKSHEILQNEEKIGICKLFL